MKAGTIAGRPTTAVGGGRRRQAMPRGLAGSHPAEIFSPTTVHGALLLLEAGALQ